jgi:hypothetical protein
MMRRVSREWVAALAGQAAPLAVPAILVPFRAGFPNSDAALALIVVVVAVAHTGQRRPGVLAALPARLRRDGTVRAGGHDWDVERDGLPPGRDIEVLAEAGGQLQGRFMLTPAPGARPALEQLRVAVAFADQVGAALSGRQLAGHRR